MMTVVSILEEGGLRGSTLRGGGVKGNDPNHPSKNTRAGISFHSLKVLATFRALLCLECIYSQGYGVPCYRELKTTSVLIKTIQASWSHV